MTLIPITVAQVCHSLHRDAFNVCLYIFTFYFSAALRLKLRKMKVVADKIILRISQSKEEHFPMPNILSAAVSNLTEKILE